MMPYWLRFTIFLIFINVLAFGAGTALSHLDFSFYWVLLFVAVAPYVLIVFGRWCLKRERL